MDEKLIQDHIQLPCREECGREGKGMPGIMKIEGLKELLRFLLSIPEVACKPPLTVPGQLRSDR